ncbi:POZ domain-containing protein [Ascobolus immersus RN42]|uniref:POZ domain-containing protein n=1 Tax=Ascobolus immersus RN42 TaxID=1160509 RepID=A0A3N4HWX8_ASCIM|nr:POZ domain-containing protein [Ascobolus immersus RN42]
MATLSQGPAKRKASDDDTDVSKRPKPPPKPAATIHDATLQLLQTGRFSDLTLKCGGEEFKVHKSVLCMQSSFFSACMDSGLKESKSNVIQLTDENVEDVKRMLAFLYGGSYWEHPEDPTDKSSFDHYRNYKDPGVGHVRSDEERLRDAVLVNLRMFEIADKFGIPGLEKQALQKLQAYSSELVQMPGSRHVPRRGLEMGPGGLFSDRLRAVFLMSQWQRILDAAERCSEFESESLWACLIDPIADLASFLATDDPKAFEELTQRLAGNAEFAVRMFQRTLHLQAKNAILLEAKSDQEVKERSSFRTSVVTFLRHVTRLMKDTTHITDYDCVVCENGRCYPQIVGTRTGHQVIDFICENCSSASDYSLSWAVGQGYVDDPIPDVELVEGGLAE